MDMLHITISACLCVSLLGLLHLLRNHLLADLLLLNQKRSHDALSDAGVATGTAIGAGDRLVVGLGVLEPSRVHVLNLIFHAKQKQVRQKVFCHKK